MKNFPKAKKLLAFLLTFAMLLSTVTSAVMVTSAEDVAVWDGTVAEAFAGGSGTKDDPYLISNGAELAYLLKTVSTVGGNDTEGKYYKLTNSIYLNDVTKADWKDNNPNQWLTSVSSNGYRFRGNFDGDGHTVYGMYYSGDSGYVGLLPVIDTWNCDVVVKDVTVSDSYISTTNNIVGVISPRLYSGNYRTAHFYNIMVTDSVSISATGGDYVGGIIGFSNCDEKSYYQFSGCAVLADISSGHALIGYGTSATRAYIIQSYTTANDWYTTYSGTNDTTYKISDLSAIKGKDAAKAAMPGFDWLRIWNCKEDGYPFPMDYNTNRVNGLNWTGLVAHEYASGSGSEEDPYIIENNEQLARIARDPSTSGKYYKIVRDLYINDVSAENWTENAKQWYGYNASSEFPGGFAGTLDGTGHTVYGLYYNGSAYYVGLFGKIAGGTIKNLAISESSLISSSTGGSISVFAGYVGGSINYTNCVVDETVTIKGAHATGYASYGQGNVTIKNCVSVADITGTKYTGAFIADVWSSTLTVSNSFGLAQLSPRRSISGSDNYSTVADSYGTTVVTAEQMQGADALKNMANLTGFGTTDTYPVIYQQGTKGAVWSGSVAADYAGGNGTKADPYKIETGEQLVKLIRDPNTSGKYYSITADIKLNDTTAENWTTDAKQWFGYNGAGEITGKFAGTLNGDLHTISGLYYNGDKYYVGLFGAIGGATVNKVIIDNSYLATSNSAGNISAFTGYVNGAINYNECVVGKNVTISGVEASGYGSWSSGNVTVDSCMALADVTGTGHAGAFFADIWSSTLKISNSIGIGAFSPRRAYTGTNNYGTVADSYGVNVVTEEQMQGADALENMPLLTGYFATTSYPVRYNNGTAGAVWSGGIALEFASGSGTKTDPYVIETGEQLAKMITMTSSGVYYKLGADIVLSDETEANNWLDSTKAVEFAGDFSGNGYIITGLNYDATVTGMVYAGLIPCTNGAYISNVILEDSKINMTTNAEQATYAGGIVGYVKGNTNLYSCYVAQSVEIKNILADSSAAKKNAVGGLIGGGQAGFTIDGCTFFGTLDGFDYRYGAVFGDVWGVTQNDRVVKYTMVDNYVPSFYWGFVGSHNASTVAPAEDIDVNASFTVAETLKGDDGFAAVEKANWNGRYFGTEGYPVLSSLGARFKDVNGDRICNSVDLVMMRNNLVDSSKLGYMDLNGDGKGDLKDLVWLKKKFVRESAIDGYELVWYDEFDGSVLDDTKWNTTQTRMADTNELAQTNLSAARSVSDGNLQLSALKNPYYNADSDDYFEKHKYMTTGSVTTEGKMSYQYGYLEIRAKVPYKEGCWPSFWLRSHNATNKQANPNFEVEVDVFEVFGNTSSMASNLHQQNYNGSSYMTNKSSINDAEKHTFADAEDLSNEYHTYAFEWEPDRMAVYVDGDLQCEWSLNRWALLTYGLKMDTSGFNTTMNILFNNHLFTNSSTYESGTVIEDYENNLPAEFDIDYVRLYQKNDGVSKLILN